MEKNNETTKDISTFDITNLMKETYNKIAKWHNDCIGEAELKAGLKILSTELIEDIAGAAFTHLGIPYKGARIQMDENTRKKVEVEKEKMNVEAGLILPSSESIKKD